MQHVQPELLDVTALVPLLNKHLTMTLDDNYTLMNPLIAPTERAMALLYMILPKKGENAYINFARCLQEEKHHMGHRDLVKLLCKCKLFMLT